jgi:hypothetical protein
MVDPLLQEERYAEFARQDSRSKPAVADQLREKRQSTAEFEAVNIRRHLGFLRPKRLHKKQQITERLGNLDPHEIRMEAQSGRLNKRWGVIALIAAGVGIVVSLLPWKAVLGLPLIVLMAIAIPWIAAISGEHILDALQKRDYPRLAVASTLFLAALISTTMFSVMRMGTLGERVAEEARPPVIMETPSSALRTDSGSPAPLSEHEKGKGTFYTRFFAFLVVAFVLGSSLFELAGFLFLSWGKKAASHLALADLDELDSLNQDLELIDEGLEWNESYAERCMTRYDTVAVELRGHVQETSFQKRVAAVIFTVLLAILLGVVLLTLFASAARGATVPQQGSMTVICLDVSTSAGVKDSNGITLLQANCVQIEKYLAKAAPGEEVSIVKIGRASYASPTLLFHGHLDSQPGYFGERLDAGRRALSDAWRKYSASLRAVDNESDVIGALMSVAEEQLVGCSKHSCKLLVASDMRHFQLGGLDLERPSRLNVDRLAKRVQSEQLIPNLANVDVVVSGMRGQDRSTAYFRDLRRFWEKYFEFSRAKSVTMSSYDVIAK